jgi:hypothetical protein
MHQALYSLYIAQSASNSGVKRKLEFDGNDLNPNSSASHSKQPKLEIVATKSITVRDRATFNSIAQRLIFNNSLPMSFVEYPEWRELCEFVGVKPQGRRTISSVEVPK